MSSLRGTVNPVLRISHFTVPLAGKLDLCRRPHLDRGEPCERVGRCPQSRPDHSFECRRARPDMVTALPRISAARRVVIDGAVHRWQFRAWPSRQAARPHVYASPALGVNARFCRGPRALAVILAAPIAECERCRSEAGNACPRSDSPVLRAGGRCSSSQHPLRPPASREHDAANRAQGPAPPSRPSQVGLRGRPRPRRRQCLDAPLIQGRIRWQDS
jgi:hypothetical protein